MSWTSENDPVNSVERKCFLIQLYMKFFSLCKLILHDAVHVCWLGLYLITVHLTNTRRMCGCELFDTGVLQCKGLGLRPGSERCSLPLTFRLLQKEFTRFVSNWAVSLSLTECFMVFFFFV